MEYLLPLGILDGIIDNDITKIGQEIYGLRVYDYPSAKPLLKEAGVIIAHLSYEESEMVLERDNISFYRLGDFITAWFREKHRQNAIGFLDFIITTKCTLNCKDCMQYIPWRTQNNISAAVLTGDLKALFSQVSFVGEMSIIGGEPFMHTKLEELLKYIGSDFRQKIGSIVITTNGTITPKPSLLEQCRKAGAGISISDYTGTVPPVVYEEQVAELEAAAKKAGVNARRKGWSWLKPGRFDAEEGSEFIACGQSHMQLYRGRLWRCTLMAGGYAAGFCKAREVHDYYKLHRGNSELMRRFLCHRELLREHIGDAMATQTSQCGACWFPKKISVPSAVQE